MDKPLKFDQRESKHLSKLGNEIHNDLFAESQNLNNSQGLFGSMLQATKRNRKKKPPRFIARRLLKKRH